MFWYLHFTRPPPSHGHPSQPLTITPSIANDLRTDYPTVQIPGIEIYYAWVKSVESPVSATSTEQTDAKIFPLGPMSQPKKLTDWTGNSYKEISVYPPTFVQEGERWHLLLCARHPVTKQLVTSIGLPSGSQAENSSGGFGTEILPIISSAILFTAKKSAGDKKQVQNERLLKLPQLWGKSVGPLRLKEHISFDLDKVR